MNEPSVLEACGLVDINSLCSHWEMLVDDSPSILLDEIHGLHAFSLLPGPVYDELHTLQDILVDRIIGGEERLAIAGGVLLLLILSTLSMLGAAVLMLLSGITP